MAAPAVVVKPKIRIMCWNIQTFGQAKARREGIVGIIAQVIAQYQPDIFTINELLNLEAMTVLDEEVANTLPLASGVKYKQFYTVKSKTAGKTADTKDPKKGHGEYYAFLVKQGLEVLTIEEADYQYGDLKSNAVIAVRGTGTSNVQNMQPATAASASSAGSYQNVVPLLAKTPASGFGGGRPPALFLSKIAGKFLALVVVHLRPDSRSDDQLYDLIYNLIAKTVGKITQNIIITGDFNIEFEDSKTRDAITSKINKPSNPVWTTAITAGSSFIGPDGKEHLFDNFIYTLQDFNALGVAITSRDDVWATIISTPNIASMLKAQKNTEKQNETIAAFEAAINSDKDDIEVMDNTVRLISDHLPVILEIQVK